MNKKTDEAVAGIKAIPKSMLLLGITVLLLLVFTLYLAPGKHLAADVLAAVLLLIWLTVIGVRRSGIENAIKPLAPFLILLFYIIALNTVHGLTLDTGYIQQLLVGFVPFLTMYVVFRQQLSARMCMLAVAIFLIPGLVHLVYMYFDIFAAMVSRDARVLLTPTESVGLSHLTERLNKLGYPISQSSSGVLEGIKEAPRTGRRYASMAILHLLCGGLLLGMRYKLPAVRYFAGGLIALSILTLALLDARAAYASVLIGGFMVFISIGAARASTAMKLVLKVKFWQGLVLAGLVALILIVGFSAGKSRWFSMSYSFEAAKHDVIDSQKDLKSRPYVDHEFWVKPLESLDDEDLRFRLQVDQSAYLRVAWLIVGLQSLIENPWGVGSASNYFGRLWGVAGDEGKYQRGDSFFVENLISGGVISLLLHPILLFSVGRCLRRSVVDKGFEANVLIMILAGIIFICLGRSLVDVFAEGAWRYFMALLGMYYGLLHADRRWTKE